MKHNTVDYELIRRLRANKLTRQQIRSRTGLCDSTLSMAFKKLKENGNEGSRKVETQGNVIECAAGEKIRTEG